MTTLRELPTSIHSRVKELSAAGEAALEAEDYRGAIDLFEEALDLLPDPKHRWEAELWLLAAMGDAAFLAGDLELARMVLMQAMRDHDEANGNPFLRLRLGQCLLDLGELDPAANWLAGAFLLEGPSLFEGEDPRFLDFVRPKLGEPDGGWPHDW